MKPRKSLVRWSHLLDPKEISTAQDSFPYPRPERLRIWYWFTNRNGKSTLGVYSAAAWIWRLSRRDRKGNMSIDNAVDDEAFVCFF